MDHPHYFPSLVPTAATKNKVGSSVCISIIAIEMYQYVPAIIDLRNCKQYRIVHCCHVPKSSRKVSNSLSDFKQIRSFSTDFRKSIQYQTSRKCVQWEPR